MTETPPEGFSDEKKADASTSQELPVVVLGELEEHPIEPRKRLLQGRVEPKFLLWPAMIAQTFAGLLVFVFALQSPEWSPTPIVLTWFCLFLWTWFYGISYRYRRRLLKFLSSGTLIVMSALVAVFCFDRAAAQSAWDGSKLAARPEVGSLSVAAVLTIIGAAIVVAHILFFGRGYREKRE